MNVYGGVEVYLHAFLIHALDGDECSAPRISRFNAGKTAPVDLAILQEGGWAPEPIRTLWWHKNSAPARNRTSVVQIVTQ
jgi:hypothetical protein